MRSLINSWMIRKIIVETLERGRGTNFLEGTWQINPVSSLSATRIPSLICCLICCPAFCLLHNCPFTACLLWSTARHIQSLPMLYVAHMPQAGQPCFRAKISSQLCCDTQHLSILFSFHCYCIDQGREWCILFIKVLKLKGEGNPTCFNTKKWFYRKGFVC